LDVLTIINHINLRTTKGSGEGESVNDSIEAAASSISVVLDIDLRRTKKAPEFVEPVRKELLVADKALSYWMMPGPRDERDEEDSDLWAAIADVAEARHEVLQIDEQELDW
jgi:hypothetical protein